MIFCRALINSIRHISINLIAILFNSLKPKKHVISTGVGSCANAGTTDGTTYYCGTGQNCNNWNGFSCWSPKDNAQASTACTNAQWQCSVIENFFLKKITLPSKISNFKTTLADGTGQCSGVGSTSSTQYMCGSGSNCNNWSGKTCWNPKLNAQVATPCTSSQWQCSVSLNSFQLSIIEIGFLGLALGSGMD